MSGNEAHRKSNYLPVPSNAARGGHPTDKLTYEVAVEKADQQGTVALQSTLSKRLAARESRNRARIQSLLTHWDNPLTKEELRQRRECGMPSEWIRSSTSASEITLAQKSSEEREFEAALARRRMHKQTSTTTPTSTYVPSSAPSGIFGGSWKALWEGTVVAVDQGLRIINPKGNDVAQVEEDFGDTGDYFLDEFGNPMQS
jgi:hypothetical protein